MTVPPLITRAMRSRPIFQIGFNKCGTNSLHEFLCDSGISALHWHGGALATRIMRRIRAGQDPIMDYPTTIGFSDMILVDSTVLLEPYKSFDYLHRWYPNALFMLTTRSRENWIASRLAHRSPNARIPLSSRYAEYLHIPEAEVPDFWRAEWDAHHALARAYFSSSPNFLEFDIERDDPERVRRFVGRYYEKCADAPFGMHNRGTHHPIGASA
jgi:sulfotransferase family protein